MTTIYPELRGKFTVSAGDHTINVGSDALTINTGDYFTAGYDSEGGDYITDVQTQIRTIANQSNALVAYAAATGRVTITLNTAAALSMDAELIAALGFAASVSANAAAHVATRVPQHIWRPTRGMSDAYMGSNALMAPRSSTIVGRSVDGTSYSRKGNTLYDDAIAFDKLPEADVKTPDDGTIYRDLQQFFLDVVAEGETIRVFPDRTVTTSSDYVNTLWGSENDEEVGSFTDYAGRHVSAYQGLWDVGIPLMKKI